MRKILCAVLVAAVLSFGILMPGLSISIVKADANDDFAGGKGTEAAPYLIRTPNQLDNVRKYSGEDYVDYYFKLDSDIDLKDWLADNGDGNTDGKGWLAIGNVEPFFANFDGGGYEIRNLWLNRSEDDYSGLFGLMFGSKIENLNVILDKEKGIIGGMNSGAIAGMVMMGYTEPEINNCSATGLICSPGNGEEISSYGYSVGGLFGYLEIGVVSQCYFQGKVLLKSANSETNEDSAGGIIGNADSAKIKDCYVCAEITVENEENPYEFSGGIAGYWLQDITVEKCYFINTGNSLPRPILGIDPDFVGGQPPIRIISCYYGGNPIFEHQPGSKSLTEEKFKQKESFVNTADAIWDFENVWGIYEGEGTPYLKGFKNAVRIVPSAGNDIYDGTSKMPDTEHSRVKGCEITITSIIPPNADMKNAGTYNVIVEYETAHNYQITVGKYEIKKAILTVSALPLTRGAYDGDPILQYKITGFLNGENKISAGVTGLENLSYTTAAESTRGKYAVTITNADLSAPNYDFIYEPGEITVTGLYHGEIAAISISGAVLLLLAAFSVYWFGIKRRTLAALGAAVAKPFTRTKIQIEKQTVVVENTVYVDKPAVPLPATLTEREREVAAELLSGKKREEISAQLFISESTLNKHTAKIYEKTGCSSRVDFIKKYGGSND